VPPVATDPDRVSARPKLWRITDRRTFATLRRHGARARRHGVTVTWVPPAPAHAADPPRAAFAVTRGAGAVARNRVRRRLRAALRELCTEGRVPPGDYLLGATPDVVALPWTSLVQAVGDAVAEATAGRP
jgi:ribonuclease P protein component